MKTVVAIRLLCVFLTCGLVTSLYCSNGYFWDGTNGCLKCPDNCQFCESRDYCLSCENGYWGTICEKPCTLCKAETSCRRINGFCLNACKDGYTGVLCDSRCSEKCMSCNRTNAQVCLNCAQGWYQPVSCNKPCPEACYNRSCNATGSCEYGCEKGFWGQTCEWNCSGHCVDAACYQANGSCLFGCKEGYTGTPCEKERSNETSKETSKKTSKKTSKETRKETSKETNTKIFVPVGIGVVFVIVVTVVCIRRKLQKHTGSKRPAEKSFPVEEQRDHDAETFPLIGASNVGGGQDQPEERQPATTEKVNELQLVKEGDHTKYEQFKRCLNSSGQEHLVEAIEAAEKEEYTSTVRREPRTEEEKLLQGTKKQIKSLAYPPLKCVDTRRETKC